MISFVLSGLAAVLLPIALLIVGWRAGYRCGRSDGYEAGRLDSRLGRAP